MRQWFRRRLTPQAARIILLPCMLLAVAVPARPVAQGQASARAMPERFEIRIPDAVLSDLRERLGRTRWPDQVPGTGWDYGADTAYLRELADYWRIGFDW